LQYIKNRMLISILVPCFNEEKTIETLIANVKKAKLSKGITREIIVVDDASTDKTPEILEKIKGIKVYQHKKNKGKGSAVRLAINKTHGEILIIQDADLEYDPVYYSKLLKPILSGKADVVYGTRLKNYPLRLLGERKTPLISHYVGNKFLSLMTRIIYAKPVSDMETGYKVFRKNVLKNINLSADRFDFEAEFTAKLLREGYNIYEIPIKVELRGYNDGKKITWKDGFIALWSLIKYRFID